MNRTGENRSLKSLLTLLLCFALLLSASTGLALPAYAAEDAAPAAFRYEHDPRLNPAAMADIVVDPTAVYGFAPSPDGSLKQYATYDWSDPAVVNGENGRLARIAYHESIQEMYTMLDEMTAQGKSVEEIARAVSTKRNEIRLAAYDNDPEGLATAKARNLERYGHEEGPLPEELYEQYGSWEAVIEKAFSANSGMDACLGLYDDYYELYIASGQIEDESVAAASREYAVAAFMDAVGYAPVEDAAAAVSAYSDAGEISPWYLPEVAAAADGKIVLGYEDATLRPASEIRRIEAFVILARCLPELDTEGTAETFGDVPAWAEEEIGRLSSAGLIEGYGDGSLGAQDKLTVEQVSLLLDRLSGDGAAVSYTGQGTVGNGWVASEIYGAVSTETLPSLKDDFATAVNAEYLSGLTIRPGYSGAGVIRDIQDILEERNLAILTDTEIEGRDAELLQTFYALVLDWDARDAVGITPFLTQLERIENAETLEDFNALVLEDSNVSAAIGGAYVSNSLAEPGMNTVFIDVPGLLLPDAAEYADLENLGESSRKDMELYNGIMGYMLERAGYTEDAAQRVIDGHWQAEQALAAHMLTREDQNRDDFYERISNVLTLEEVRDIEGSYPMDQILHARGYDVSPSYLVTQPDFWKFLGTEFYTQENVPLIRDYFIGDLCIGLAEYLDQDAYRSYDALVNARYGIEGTLPDEIMAADYTDRFLSSLEDNVFIEQYCTPEEKQTVLDMIDGLIAVYEEMLRTEDWLSDATIEKAIRKLETMGRKAIYPDTLPDFSDLEFASAAEGGTLLDAIDAIRAYNRAEEVEMIGKPADPDEWGASTRVSNAYYNFLDNELVILSGMAMGLFGTDAPYAQVLGALGNVIGHEISHAFDPNGALFDETGALNDWWTEEDYEAFGRRTQKLIDYYDQIIPWEGAQAVDGDAIKGEAIADMAGMKAALMLASDIEDFDYDLFFRSYAKSWADVYPFDRVEYLLATDEHPLEYLRINTVVSQFQEFYDTYDVQPGDGMYLAPADRVSVW